MINRENITDSEVLSLIKHLENAIAKNDDFSASVIITRLENLGYTLKIESDKIN